MTNLLLLYTMRPSQTNSGGLAHCKWKPKWVEHFACIVDLKKCFVRVYKKYRSLCPADSPADTSYLTPFRIPRPDYWYSTQPIGHNILSTVVRWMCIAAGISGHWTNHSLRTTAATQLFQKGIDEQLIMHVTGHRNTTGVRCYKRISEDQKQHLSVCREVEPTDKKFKEQQTIPNLSSDVKLLSATTPCTQHPQFNFTDCTVSITYNN